ncbi:membrane associated rhomboid family serine protease [Haloferula luteola]|uniref:Membrane associated rhomboid family serine protease n=1 Tax=Haloferula luteola TaxID=595692 RepID=A0A840UZS6_9BACT|nr:membrane associated rhomboid family serine protease [Haloferula luteola]
MVDGSGQISSADTGGGVAYAAHIGGFVAGVITGIFARLLMKEEPDTPFRRLTEPRYR